MWDFTCLLLRNKKYRDCKKYINKISILNFNLFCQILNIVYITNNNNNTYLLNTLSYYDIIS